MFIISESSDGEHFAKVSSVGLTQSFSPEPVPGLRIFLQVVEVSLQVWVSVGVRMCEIYRIIIMVKLNTESKRVVMARCLFLYWVLVVTDILASSLPTFACSRRLFVRIH